MKKYKKLQHNVDESLKNIRDEQLLETLKSQNESLNYEKPKNKQRSFKLAMACSCAAVILITMLIGIPFIFKPNNDNGHYAYKDVYSSMSSLEELNNYTKIIDLNERIEWDVIKYCDNVYNHTLYFVATIEIKDTLENFEITIVVNKDYEYSGDNVEYDKIHNISNQKLLYFEKYKEDDGLYLITTKGKIDTTQEVVYIEYKGIAITEESTFIDSITSLLIFS